MEPKAAPQKASPAKATSPRLPIDDAPGKASTGMHCNKHASQPVMMRSASGNQMWEPVSSVLQTSADSPPASPPVVLEDGERSMRCEMSMVLHMGFTAMLYMATNFSRSVKVEGVEAGVGDALLRHLRQVLCRPLRSIVLMAAPFAAHLLQLGKLLADLVVLLPLQDVNQADGHLEGQALRDLQHVLDDVVPDLLADAEDADVQEDEVHPLPALRDPGLRIVDGVAGHVAHGLPHLVELLL
eukprot:1972465-Lingulodinium_polyedra.AAC.1